MTPEQQHQIDACARRFAATAETLRATGYAEAAIQAALKRVAQTEAGA